MPNQLSHTGQSSCFLQRPQPLGRFHQPPCGFLGKGLGLQHKGSLYPGARLASMWGRVPAPKFSKGCLDLAMIWLCPWLLFICFLIWKIFILSLPNSTCVMPCPLGAGKGVPIALRGHFQRLQPFCPQQPAPPPSSESHSTWLGGYERML